MGHPVEEISVAGKPIGDDNPRDYLDTLQLNPYPLTCPLTAVFEQLGDNGQPGGMVKDHEPVMQLPFYLYPLLIDIDDGAFDMGDEKTETCGQRPRLIPNIQRRTVVLWTEHHWPNTDRGTPW